MLISVGASIFIVGYIIFIWFWDLPSHSIGNQLLKKYAGALIDFLGLFHTWALFAPLPANGSTLNWFEIVTQQGHIERFDLPLFLPNDPDFDTRMARFLHTVNVGRKPIVCKSVARYVLRQFVRVKGLPIERVRELRFFVDRAYPIPFQNSDFRDVNQPVRTEWIYTYKVCDG